MKSKMNYFIYTSITYWRLYSLFLSSQHQDKTCFQKSEDIKRINAPWIQPQFDRNDIYPIQACQDENASRS